MKSFLVVLFLALLPSGAFAQDINCDDQSNLTTIGMKFCAAQTLERVDGELNVAWKKVKAFMADIDKETGDFLPEKDFASKSLLSAQRNWLKYRDGHCETVGAKYMGGTMQPLAVTLCHAELTRKRTDEILLLMEEG